MVVSRYLLENKTYQNLDDVQKSYINILQSSKVTPADAEDALINFFQHSTEQMLSPSTICNTINELINGPTPLSLVSDTVTKMVKNGDGITGFLIELDQKPDFIDPSTWNKLKQNKPRAIKNRLSLVK